MRTRLPSAAVASLASTLAANPNTRGTVLARRTDVPDRPELAPKAAFTRG